MANPSSIFSYDVVKEFLGPRGSQRKAVLAENLQQSVESSFLELARLLRCCQVVCSKAELMSCVVQDRIAICPQLLARVTKSAAYGSPQPPKSLHEFSRRSPPERRGSAPAHLSIDLEVMAAERECGTWPENACHLGENFLSVFMV